MPRKVHLRKITRPAAIQLALYACGILGVSFGLVQTTIWKTGPEREPFYSFLPGVDFAGLPSGKAQPILTRLNLQRCPCDCGRTVASCRNHHQSCSLSLALARQAVAAARR